MLFLSFFCFFTYFIASIPFAVVFSKAKGIDLAKVGSGNLGATNVYRAMGLKWAVTVFLLDMIKGFVPVFVAMHFFEGQFQFHVSIALMAIVAHTMSVWVKFKGGKGVATGLGVLGALSPPSFLCLAAIAFLIIYRSRYVALASVIASGMAPSFLYFFGAPKEYVFFISIAAAFIIFKHRANIKRLLDGTENKI